VELRRPQDQHGDGSREHGLLVAVLRRALTGGEVVDADDGHLDHSTGVSAISEVRECAVDWPV
jgi:hypothetical protein